MTREMEFRDGKRAVPEHLAVLLAMFNTVEYTYEEATRIANDALVIRQLRHVEQDIIRKHFAEHQ